MRGALSSSRTASPGRSEPQRPRRPPCAARNNGGDVGVPSPRSGGQPLPVDWDPSTSRLKRERLRRPQGESMLGTERLSGRSPAHQWVVTSCGHRCRTATSLAATPCALLLGPLRRLDRDPKGV